MKCTNPEDRNYLVKILLSEGREEYLFFEDEYIGHRGHVTLNDLKVNAPTFWLTLIEKVFTELSVGVLPLRERTISVYPKKSEDAVKFAQVFEPGSQIPEVSLRGLMHSRRKINKSIQTTLKCRMTYYSKKWKKTKDEQ